MNLPSPLFFEWDDGNINKSLDKHKIYHKEAEEAFFNKPIKIYKDIKHSQIEKRYYLLGITNHRKYLYITFTLRNSRIRVVSARKQSKKEKELYEK
ncbi:hypothetical protein A3D80_00645 [Candidatus Roizmanbacteria bacterium RIFCSPHIGHO2_02_FULL_40_13b]|uniref:Toxin n=1 Tax=Candidatus Roizmanbacteria bacterium RIFCSPHIGHO2_01_FULL_39_24 TaxID=1802032 RepID=A0A1F7GL39_9BACT|nr:MAG: hypothetical protein A2799_02610 [Candidatus Roizmanbacteria bacterium RIFCSPHIGHO2_01_FULL_39_24]OGK27455.1 MAG: hypothetical protein A3D80_00645 [Candidatus Roizmanbacteria bacterium RIFCSPHIGHO2_02_FULL_40_13b]OGK50012.1 MAG: hypothetical protein A3A56_00945 [Candidatus Roizmanbacteria bacterium RIFCSPLOWO2_01_FULL_40_32]OGK56531.1 MAG: hypothetical protein A3H83_03955 [Candidatus Roizmanbacteria bacterium RIFCSPLOWO2_02_FULL_39_8]